MQQIITLPAITVTIDPDAWDLTYATTDTDREADVLSYVLTQLNGSAAANECDLVASPAAARSAWYAGEDTITRDGTVQVWRITESTPGYEVVVTADTLDAARAVAARSNAARNLSAVDVRAIRLSSMVAHIAREDARA